MSRYYEKYVVKIAEFLQGYDPEEAEEYLTGEPPFSLKSWDRWQFEKIGRNDIDRRKALKIINGMKEIKAGLSQELKNSLGGLHSVGPLPRHFQAFRENNEHEISELYERGFLRTRLVGIGHSKMGYEYYLYDHVRDYLEGTA